MEARTDSDPIRLTWGRRVREDARHEFRGLVADIRRSRAARWWRRRVVWPVEAWLLGWTEHADPVVDHTGRLLAEDDDGNWLVPAGTRDGEPWWQGRWRWWRPAHWPVYLRSRRRGTYAMVERW